jgi:hypothetical protein
MIEKLIFAFLVFWSLKVIWEKYNIQYKIGELSLKFNSKLLHEISECQFCLEHHLAVVPVLISFLFFKPEWMDIFMPLMIAGLSNLISALRN